MAKDSENRRGYNLAPNLALVAEPLVILGTRISRKGIQLGGENFTIGPLALEE